MGLMRRTPLKRGGTLKKTPLKSGSQLKPVGKVKKNEIAQSSEVRTAYLATHPRCEVGKYLQANKIKGWKNCRGYAEGIHERQKRSQGGSVVDLANLMSACNVCNGWVEDNPKEARRLGLMVHAHENPRLVPLVIKDEKIYGNA